MANYKVTVEYNSFEEGDLDDAGEPEEYSDYEEYYVEAEDEEDAESAGVKELDASGIEYDSVLMVKTEKQ